VSFVDLHQDTPRLVHDPAIDLIAGSAAAQVDLPRLEAAGARAVVWAACDDERRSAAESLAYVTGLLAGTRELIGRSNGRLRLVRGAADLEGIAPNGPVRVVLAVEGAHSLAGSLAALEALHALGLRLLVLTWNHGNPFGSGCRDEIDEGVTPLGRELIARALELGIACDLAHASPRTLAGALPLLDRPFLVSHTACAALHPHPRNLSDAQLRAVAAAGGVVGIMLYPPFLAPSGTAVTAATVAAHVRHAIEIAGEDAVALGTDFDGMNDAPVDLTGFQDLPRLCAALAAAGLSETAIEKVAWRNAERALRGALRGGER
jgi:membrane dipeptidase